MEHLNKIISQLIRVEDSICALPLDLHRLGKPLFRELVDELEVMQDKVDALRLSLYRNSEDAREK